MRIRTVKPEFWQDEDLAEISETARLVAIGLLNCADDEGFFNANERLVQSSLFPLTEPSLSVHECFNQLVECGYLKLYACVEGKKTYGHVVNFTKHQKVNRPSPSRIKPVVDFTEHSVRTHKQLTVGKEQGTGNREQVVVKTKSAKANQDVVEVFNYWKEVMKKPSSSILNPKRTKAIEGRFKEGYTVYQIKMAITGCSMTPHNMGQNDNNKKYDDIELICRDGVKVETFANNCQEILPLKQKQQMSSFPEMEE